MSKKGYKQSEEHKKKISKTLKGRHFGYKFPKGNKNPMYGKHPSEGTRRKMSESHKGEKCHLWKGGISKGYKEGYWTLEYKLWRMKIFQRDNFTCQFCGIKTHIGLGKSVYLTAHHIKSWAKYPELRFDINNGITLCEECHKLTDNYKGKGRNNILG